MSSPQSGKPKGSTNSTLEKLEIRRSQLEGQILETQGLADRGPGDSVEITHKGPLLTIDDPATHMAAQQPRTRPKEKVAGDEEATADLKLGEFANVPTLSNSETALLLSAVKEKRMNTKNPLSEGEILTKTEDYLDVFSRFKRKESIASVEKILEQTNLARFERSQIANLCCESAEEVKGLIPSIANKISDVDLQNALDEIAKLRNFIE